MRATRLRYTPNVSPQATEISTRNGRLLYTIVTPGTMADGATEDAATAYSAEPQSDLTGHRTHCSARRHE